MMRYQTEPMIHWPYPDTGQARKSNPFRVGHQVTMDLLESELEHLKVTGPVAIRVVTQHSDIRRDGLLRSGARVTHPGVALSFISKFGPMTYPCDAFIHRSTAALSWQVNLRAIALGLQALRTLNRYGITGRGEQYTGWLAIGAATTPNDGASDREQAERFLRSVVDNALANAPIRQVWRAATRKTHPDTTGEASALWDAVHRAGATLDLTK